MVGAGYRRLIRAGLASLMLIVTACVMTNGTAGAAGIEMDAGTAATPTSEILTETNELQKLSRALHLSQRESSPALRQGLADALEETILPMPGLNHLDSSQRHIASINGESTVIVRDWTRLGLGIAMIAAGVTIGWNPVGLGTIGAGALVAGPGFADLKRNYQHLTTEQLADRIREFITF